jgi:probable DNA metabolism protein
MRATPHIVELAHATDVDGFRRHARQLIAAGHAPEHVHWQVRGSGTGSLFGDGAAVQEAHGGGAMPADAAPAPLRVPPALLQLAQSAILHRAPARFAMLYRFLWRLALAPELRHDRLDADRIQLEEWAAAVRRDMHKMTAFVRFRTVADNGSNGPLHVAWFEPDHHIVPATAPFFQRRFAQMRWAILTPECSVQWDGATLDFGPGAKRADAPAADAGEALWLTYYQHIFNPARLKVKMMEQEMPRRYWRNLPEAALIGTLAAEAAGRSAAMIAQGPRPPNRKRAKASGEES